MDLAAEHCDLTAPAPAWRRWLLFAALLLLGMFYVGAYAFFRERSHNFIETSRNAAALRYSEAHPISVPARLTFGTGGNDNARLGGGWHAPDPGGTWTTAKDAWLELVVAEPRDDFALRLQTTAFVPPGNRETTITVDVNGVKAGAWRRRRSDASTPIDVYVPRTQLGDGLLQVHLRTNDLGSPLRWHTGNDDRILGLLLSSAELTASKTNTP